MTRPRLLPNLVVFLTAAPFCVSARAAGGSDEETRILSELHAVDRAETSRGVVGDVAPVDQARVRKSVERGPFAIPDMIQALESSKDVGERIDALIVLAHFGPRSAPAVPALLGVLQRTDSHRVSEDASADLSGRAEEEVAVRALTAIGKEAAPPLIEALAERRAPLRAVSRVLAAMGPPVVPSLLGGLASRPPLVRLRVALLLGDSRPVLPETVRELARLVVDDPDWETRENALESLGRMGTEARPAVPALLKALEDPRFKVSAAQVLAGIGGEPRRVAEVLLKELRSSEDDWGARRVIEPLGLTAAEVPDAFDALVEALRCSPFDRVRVASARALGRMGPAARAAVVPLVMATEDEGEDMDEHQSVEKESRAALARIGVPSPDAVGDLIVLLGHRTDWVRLSAAEALGRIGPPARAAVPALARGILPEAGWGGAWAKAIGQIGEAPPDVVATLEEATRVRDPARWSTPQQSAYALIALGKGRESAERYFLRRFNSRLDSDEFRIDSAEGLRQLGEEEPRVIRFLTDLVWRTADQGTEPWVAQRATDVLAKYGPKAGAAVPGIVRWLELRTDWYRSSGLAALRAIDTEEARAALKRFGPSEPKKPAAPAPPPLPRLRAPSQVDTLVYSLRNSPAAEDRARSARELGGLGEAARPAVFALVLAAGDEPPVAEASVAALERLGAPEPTAAEGLARLLYDKMEGTDIEAAKALGRIGPPAKKAAALALALSASPTRDKEACAAIDALARIGVDTPEALKALKEAVTESHPWDNWDIPLHAAHALIDLGKERELVRSYFAGLLEYDALLVKLDGAEGLIHLGEPDAAAAALADAIDHGETSTAQRAVALMGRCGPQGDLVLPALERRLERDAGLSGPVLAQALRSVGTPRALDILRRHAP